MNLVASKTQAFKRRTLSYKALADSWHVQAPLEVPLPLHLQRHSFSSSIDISSVLLPPLYLV
jgi:hypothetical protein